MKKLFFIFLLSSCIVSLLQGKEKQATSEDALIKKFAPVVYLHPQERYFPCGVGWFVERCSIWKLLDDDATSRIHLKPNERIAKTGRIKAHEVSKLGQFSDGYYFLKPKDESTFKGEPIKNNTCNAPCYAHAVKKYLGGYVIQYLFFYAYNGPTINLGAVSFGSHIGDWEHIDIHLSEDLTIKEIYLAAHGANTFGSYISAKNIRWYKEDGKKTTHPIIYAAQSGHSSYTKEIKYFNKALDRTGKGAKWNTQKTVVNIDSPGQEWINFRGQWGSSKSKSLQTEVGSPQTPSYQSWWRKENKDNAPEKATIVPLEIKASTKKVTPSKVKQTTTFLSSLWKKQKNKPHHSKVFDLEGKFPTRSKQFLISVTQQQEDPAVKSFSIYQERLTKSDKEVYKDILVKPEGVIVTRPKFDEDRENNNLSLTSLYITDVKLDTDSKKEVKFIINIHPLEV